MNNLNSSTKQGKRKMRKKVDCLINTWWYLCLRYQQETFDQFVKLGSWLMLINSISYHFLFVLSLRERRIQSLSHLSRKNKSLTLFELEFFCFSSLLFLFNLISEMNLLRLPLELIREFLTFLDASRLCALSQTCKFLKEIGETNEYWGPLFSLPHNHVRVVPKQFLYVQILSSLETNNQGNQFFISTLLLISCLVIRWPIMKAVTKFSIWRVNFFQLFRKHTVLSIL